MTISENSVICSTCSKILEHSYNFKTKCLSIENSINPFVSENVKINLKEIHSVIIKSEQIDNDKNICRLCLQFSENDMTLNETEKDQLQQWFPEVVSIL